MSERGKEPSPIMLPNMQSVGPLIAAQGRTIWIADAHRGDGKRFVVHADELLTAFGELEAEISHAQASAEPVAACQARPYKLRCNIRLSGVLINSFSITSSDVSTYLRHG
jgi:hypothetical protein